MVPAGSESSETPLKCTKGSIQYPWGRVGVGASSPRKQQVQATEGESERERECVCVVNLYY